MRKWIDLVENSDPLLTAIHALYDAVMHNISVDDLAVGKALRDAGYVEPKAGETHFYRALYHEVTDAERNIGSYKEVLEYYRSNPGLLDKSEAQSCVSSLSEAIDYIGSTIHMTDYDGRTWPPHRLDTPVSDLRTIWIVYEITAAPGSVLWSIGGLKKFVTTLEPRYAAMIEELMEEYGWIDEVKVKGPFKIVDVHPYDSTDHEKEYNFT